ncbi:PKD domain-containing protein [Jejuia spongiicola]|uniref:PKD domain-containing protein n=1 Tax=Jejuia spongiicola TaxID=2942207 RepID=A0ABT0QFV8_9FLAO|nr:PKD domain-containing protein [Jejuia spongiicola]MCL6295734.1 PKD domain-containing protein [Jejuia spongiicola]
MKNINQIKKRVYTAIMSVFAMVAVVTILSCDPTIESLSYDLPEASSKADATPPTASFSASVTADYLTWTFGNTSSSATDYAWDYGDGNTSIGVDGVNTYSGEGTYTVTLTASDKLGVTSTFSLTVEVVEPPAPAAITPVIVNADFDKQAKSSGSDCTCSGWINKSLGAQGESSSGNGGSDNVLKFDNDEQDLTYQEVEITPNTDYTITVVASFKSIETGTFPSKLEIRVLSGSGYESGYTPAYFATAAEYPQDDFGYTSVAQMEDTDNNLLVSLVDNPGNDGYNTYSYSFNTGNNSSVALLMRGVNGDGTPSDDKGFLWNSGEEEIRVDSIVVEPVE